MPYLKFTCISIRNRKSSTFKSMSDTEERTRGAARKAQRGTTKHPGRSERPPADRNAVPTLRYGKDNNFASFKKKLSVAALETYKDLGRMFDLGEYYVPPEVDLDLYDLDEDPHGLNLFDLKEARKARNQEIGRMKRERAGMYAFITLHLSADSIDALKLEEDWDITHEHKNPLALWTLVESTHRVAVASRIPGVLKSEARRAYQACAQSAYESIVRFKERFDDLLENYLEHENPAMDDEDVAMDFFRALDNS